jgi:hypothetical protein
VNGTVRAEGSRELIAYATVALPALGRSVQTDARGYLALAGVPAGRRVIPASALGYAATERTLEIPTDGSLRVEFELAPEAVALAGIQVEATAGTRGSQVAGPGPLRVDARAVDLIPALGEADVLRTLQTLPAVQASSDFSSNLYVRGGSPDQNLILLDGAPLFNPFHLGGVFADIDPDAIATMQVYPGAFPARVGGRLSSVVELWTRDGGRDRVRGQGALGLISARASVDGPLPGSRGS